MEKQKLVYVNLRMEADTLEKVKALAETRGYDLSSTLRELIRRGLERAPTPDKVMKRLDEIAALIEKKK